MKQKKLPMRDQNDSCLAALLPHDGIKNNIPATKQDGFARDKKHIEILRTLFLRGPSIWTYRPALEAWVDLGELENFPSNKLPGFPQRLAAWLPSLVEHRCGIGERGGFLQRLRDGTWAGHILEHVMIELQTLAGIDAGFGKARETSRVGVYKVVVRTPDETIGLAALEAARELVMAAIEDRPCDVAGMVARLRELARAQGMGEGAQCIVKAAQERRIPWMRLEEGRLIQLGHGKHARRIWAHEPLQSGAIGETIAAKRALCTSLLRGAGIPVAESRIVDDAEEAWAEAQEIGLPVVMAAVERPVLAASAALSGRNEVMDTYSVLAASGQRLVVEQAVPGSLHRLLVVGRHVVSALRLDGQAQDVSAQLHPDTAALAELAARVIGLEVAGIDLVVADISRPLQPQQGALVCVNARPELALHARAEAEGAPRVGQAVLAQLFGEGETGRMPIVGVTGSSGTTVVARLVARLLCARGNRVGLACSEGVYLNQRQIASGEGEAGFSAAQRVLMNPCVDSAVIETGFRAILESGLGYDRCAVGIVTGIDPAETLPEFYVEEEAQLANVARTQVDVVLPDGCAVLNAADPQVAAMARLCDGEVMYFASSANAPVLAEHLAGGGRAVFMLAGRMIFASGNAQTPIAIPAGVPVAGSPELTQLLAAAAAAWGLDMSPQAIGAELAAFLDELRSAFIRAVPASASASAY